jgi:hypothetical protein
MCKTSTPKPPPVVQPPAPVPEKDVELNAERKKSKKLKAKKRGTKGLQVPLQMGGVKAAQGLKIPKG